MELVIDATAAVLNMFDELNNNKKHGKRMQGNQ